MNHPHVIDVSEEGMYLRAGNGLLELHREGRTPVTVPLAEIAAVVLAHPRLTCTRAVLSGLSEAGAAVVVCGENHLPVGMLLPLSGYHAPARRMLAQAGARLPLRKRLWQQIIRAKIRAQGNLLKRHRGDDMGLLEMARNVRSGDPENLEGQASRIYWPALFDDVTFQRRFERGDQNRYLNYGYAVLRAIVGRAICASGLHPGLGIHHHHRENAYCLADDLMEPLRPLVDEVVVEVWRSFGPDAPMDRAVKTALLEPLTGTLEMEGQRRTLFDVAARLSASLAAAFEGRGGKLALPEL